MNDLGLPQNKNLLCDLNENFEDFVDGGNTCFPINIQMNAMKTFKVHFHDIK